MAQDFRRNAVTPLPGSPPAESTVRKVRTVQSGQGCGRCVLQLTQTALCTQITKCF
jgi:hypothetical protein